MELEVGQPVTLRIWHRGVVVRAYLATIKEVRGTEVLFTNMLNEQTETQEHDLRINYAVGNSIQIIPLDTA